MWLNSGPRIYTCIIQNGENRWLNITDAFNVCRLQQYLFSPTIWFINHQNSGKLEEIGVDGWVPNMPSRAFKQPHDLHLHIKEFNDLSNDIPHYIAKHKDTRLS